jgi:gamma-glutamyl phosphate reductase
MIAMDNGRKICFDRTKRSVVKVGSNVLTENHDLNTKAVRSITRPICRLIPGAKAATKEDRSTEYLDLVIAVKVVDNLSEAIEHIAAYGSDHTEAIVTSSYERAKGFVREVNPAVVLVNAST